MVRNASRAAALVASLAALATQASAQSSCGGNYTAGDWCSDQPCGAGMKCKSNGKWSFYGGYGNTHPPCVRSGNFCDDDDEEAATVIIIVIAAMVGTCVLFAVVFVPAKSCKNQAANPRAAAFHGAVPGAPAPMQMQATSYRSNAVSNTSNAHGSYGKPVGVQAMPQHPGPDKNPGTYLPQGGACPTQVGTYPQMPPPRYSSVV